MQGSGLEGAGVGEQVVQCEEQGQVGDHPDHGGGDSGERRGEVLVAAQPFEVEGAEEDE